MICQTSAAQARSRFVWRFDMTLTDHAANEFPASVPSNGRVLALKAAMTLSSRRTKARRRMERYISYCNICKKYNHAAAGSSPSSSVNGHTCLAFNKYATVTDYSEYRNFHPSRGPMEIKVVNNNVEKALRVAKKKLAADGLFRELKRRRFYEKPSVKRKAKEREAARRRQKWLAKRAFR